MKLIKPETLEMLIAAQAIREFLVVRRNERYVIQAKMGTETFQRRSRL